MVIRGIMKNKIIVFGDPAFSIRHDYKTPNIRITRFHFDKETKCIEIVYEEGVSVKSINLSIYASIESGLIDLDVLNKIL